MLTTKLQLNVLLQIIPLEYDCLRTNLIQLHFYIVTFGIDFCFHNLISFCFQLMMAIPWDQKLEKIPSKLDMSRVLKAKMTLIFQANHSVVTVKNWQKCHTIKIASINNLSPPSQVFCHHMVRVWTCHGILVIDNLLSV